MTNLLKIRFLTVVCLLFAGCAQVPPAAEPTESPAASANPQSSPESPAPSTSASPTPEAAEPESTVISAEGIGAARLGMTLGELKQQLGANVELTVQSPFMVDFDAIAVRRNGVVQYYILHLAGQPLGDDDAIQGLLTDNPDYKTAEGVGAGTPLTEAEAVYGKVTLSYNTQNESREYARFEQQPASNLSFATGNAAQETAGIYAGPQAEFNETQDFKEGATIRSVLIICLSEGCAAPLSRTRG